MILNHNEYLNYELPENWCAEEDEDGLLIYDPNGNGAMTISFFTLIDTVGSIDAQISVMAKNFIDNNKIALHSPLIIRGSEETKMILSGTGTTPDNWFVKLWIVAKRSKVVFSTYQSEQETKEVKECDAIIESMCFTF